MPGRVLIIKGEERDTVYDSGEYEAKTSGMTIKIRGNTSVSSTMKIGKYPYKIKLQKKADLLRRGDDKTYADKNWLLLRDDALRAVTGFWVNELVGLQWTPQRDYVNVVFNGEYAGMYMLTESVERNKTARLNVSSSGYVFEYDAYWWNEPLYVKSKFHKINLNYTFKYPEDDEITQDQIDYFTDYIGRAEASMSTADYPMYIDVESFAAWMLGHDILGNCDGAGSNYYLTKYDDTDESLIKMAMLWDFDNVFVNTNRFDECHFYYCFPTLFDNKLNKSFAIAYADLWLNLSPTIVEQYSAYIDDFVASDTFKGIKISSAWDNELYSQHYDHDHNIDKARTWMKNRKIWLDANITMPSLPTAIQARRATTAETTAKETGTTTYDLLGRPVKPNSKGLRIKDGKLIVVR